MKIGRKTKKSQKFVKEGNNAAVNTNKSNWVAERNVLGNSSSMRPMSLEHLFKILPAGLVSKNNTGALRMRVTISSWRFSADLRETQKKTQARMIAKTKAAATRLAYTPRVSSFWKGILVKKESQTSGKIKTAAKEINKTNWQGSEV